MLHKITELAQTPSPAREVNDEDNDLWDSPEHSIDDDDVTLTGDDDNHTMTGMMSATALNGVEEENEADEELEDAEDSQQGVGLGADGHT